ncbi:hypothetical protein D9M70_565570 [compost metagenome]
MAQLAFHPRELRVALGVLDQAEVLVAVQGVGIDVVLHPVVEHAGRERRVAGMFAQGQVDVVRGLTAQVRVAQFVGIGGQVHAIGIELLRSGQALGARQRQRHRILRREIPYGRGGERRA